QLVGARREEDTRAWRGRARGGDGELDRRGVVRGAVAGCAEPLREDLGNGRVAGELHRPAVDALEHLVRARGDWPLDRQYDAIDREERALRDPVANGRWERGGRGDA